MSEEPTLDEFTETTVSQERQETPVGELPTDWEVEWLKDAVEINPDGFSEDDWPSETFEYISLSEASDGEIEGSTTISLEEAPSRAQRTVQQGDVLVGTVRPKQRSHGFVSEEHAGKICSSGFGVLRTESRLNSRYLLQEILSNRFFSQMEAYVAGSGYPAVKISDLKKHRVAIPPLPEQRKIATVLHTVDRAIEKTEEIISRIRTVRSGLVQDLFTNGYFDHDGSQSDQWASFPEDWELISVEELIDCGRIEKIMDGNHGERHPTSDDFVTTGIPFVTSNVVESSQVRWEDCKHLEQRTVDNLRKGFAKPGDVLLTHKGHVGRVGKVPEKIELAVLSPQVTYYRCSDGINSKFLMYYFQSSHVQKQLQAHSTQTTRDYVGITKQKQLQLALPSLKEQGKIVEVLSSVDDYINRELKTKSSIKRLKRGLQQDLLSGTVRTTDTNIEVPDEIAKHG